MRFLFIAAIPVLPHAAVRRRSSRRQPAQHALRRPGAERRDRDEPAACHRPRASRCCSRAGTPSTRRSRPAAVLAVVEPTMNGPGGDLFAIVLQLAKDRKIHALNSSGPRPGGGPPSRSSRSGNCSRIPLRGELSVSVPGVWSTAGGELLAKHGTRTLGQALAPAIKYARDGYAVSEIIADQWKSVESLLARAPNAAATFLIDGKAPAPGDIFRNPKLAASLQLIANGGRDVFYKGAIATAIADDMQRREGLHHREGPRRSPTPTGSSRCPRPIAATRFSRCRQTRRGSRRSRC